MGIGVLWRCKGGGAMEDAESERKSGNANHAGNVMMRHLHTGIILYVQNAPIVWYSKRQNMVEAATFKSKFVALRICKE
jgi:hypothetical protein